MTQILLLPKQKHQKKGGRKKAKQSKKNIKQNFEQNSMLEIEFFPNKDCRSVVEFLNFFLCIRIVTGRDCSTVIDLQKMQTQNYFFNFIFPFTMHVR